MHKEKVMKVLWFANTPCSAAEVLNKSRITGGWLSSLENELNNLDELELSICFYSEKDLAPFSYKKTTYYPVFRKGRKTKLSRLLYRLMEYKNHDKKEIRQLLSIINIVQPDLIHIHGTEENFGLIQEYTSLPIVISIQGLLTPCREKFFSGIPKCIANRNESFLNKIVALGIRNRYRFFIRSAAREEKILSMTKHVIGRTTWDYIVTRLLAPTSNYYINNEILRPIFYYEKWKINESNSEKYLVTVLSDALYKGFETIVDTATILKQKTNINFVWWVIGLTNNSSTVIITKRWKNAELSTLGIRLLGSLPDNSIVEKLKASSAYVQVSHIENSPNSLCEAQILGVPIIATFAGGTHSLINEDTGILVQEGDPYLLAGSILSLINNKDKMILLSLNARKEALIRHDKSLIVKGLQIIYKRIAIQDINK